MNAKAPLVFPGQEHTTTRRIFLIDIENIVGGVVTEQVQADLVWELLEDSVGLRASDQVIIGACHMSAIAAGLSRPSARLLVQSGQDGADLRLLEVIEAEDLGARYDEVVLISGDGIFIEAVRHLQGSGTCVTLVSRPEALATRLRFLADVVHLLPSQLDVALAA